MLKAFKLSSRLVDAMVPETASKTLLMRISQGEPEAFELLMKIYHPVVYRWAMKAGCTHAQADDAIQEAFLTAFRNFNIDRVERFRSYLWTVFRRRLADLKQKESNQPVGRGGTTANISLQEIPMAEIDESNNAANEDSIIEAVLALKDDFSKNVWTAFWRTTIHSDNPHDVAKDLRISVWAVYKARNRCRARLNEELSRLHIIRPEKLW